MKDVPLSPILRTLLGAACAVVVMWGIGAASSVLGPLLLSLLLAFAVVPFPQWLMRRFKISKKIAILLTALAALALGLYLVFALDLASVRIGEKLPTYAQRLENLYEQVTVFVTAHGIAAPALSFENVFTPERLADISKVVVPAAAAIISNGILIALLAFLFVVEMLEDAGTKQSPLGERLDYYGSDARSYVVVTAKSASINALLNLAFLLLMGVDTPIIWSSLYFFLDFIPTLGYIMALVPPTFVTLLMYGWQRALLVAGGLLLTNLIVDNVVTPMFMKEAVGVSFLEIMLSLLGWAFLLGLTGAVLAVPLTMALRKFIKEQSRDGEFVGVQSG